MTKNVWYRGDLEGSRPQDRGKVTVEGGAISFAGKKGTFSGSVQSADRRPYAFKNWVHVSYEADGGPRDAYFLCSDLLGWAGMLGANKALTEELQAAAQQG
jgi:hypothetical protein